VADPVQIASPDPEWPKKFQVAKAELERFLGERALGIEHIGSTAVRGLSAKPVIDVLVGLRTMDDVLAAASDLAKHGWEFPAKINDALTDRRFAKKEPRTHHLHLVVYQGEEWQKLIVFRDALRADPELAARYEALKRELAVKYKDQREQYTAEKTSFIRAVLKR